MNLILSCLCGALIAVSHTQEISTDLPQMLARIDAQSSGIKSLKANFRQVKHSSILRKPLVSSGVVRMLEDRVRWDTEAPKASVLVMSKEGIRIYYPDLGVVEVYRLSDQLRQLAGSPVFRLSELNRHFTIGSDLQISESGVLSLDLVPRDESLQKHLKSIRLDVQVETGIVRQVELRNADDERTEISFAGIQLNPGLDTGDLTLRVPENVRTVYPLGQDQDPDTSGDEADA